MLLLFCSFILSLESSRTIAEHYKPGPVEERPWTNYKTLKLEKEVLQSFMGLTAKQFQLNCNGQCFFHKGDSKSPSSHTCDPLKKECLLVASIASHWNRELSCPYFGASIGGFLNYTLCHLEPPLKIYTISLIRHFTDFSCPHFYIFKYQMPCIPREYVAISFHPSGSPEIDRWYTCIASEEAVSYWEVQGHALPPTRVNSTLPVNLTAPGVIFSRTVLDPEAKTLACQFIISPQLMAHQNGSDNSSSGTPYEEFLKEGTIKVKLAQGIVARMMVEDNEIPSELLNKVQDPNAHTSKEAMERLNGYFAKQQSLLYPIFDPAQNPPQPPDPQTMVAAQFTGPSEDTINFAELVVSPISNLHEAPTPTMEEDVATQITYLSRRCDKKEYLGKVFCFYPNTRKSCIYRERCPVLVMVEEIAGKKLLQFILISYADSTETGVLKRVVRPAGWAAIGFSKDMLMGDDLVVACQFDGSRTDIVVAWNDRHSNEYDSSINQDLIFNKEAIRFIREKSSEKLMCKWQMEWKFRVDLSKYEARKQDGGNRTSETFDLEEKGGTYIMIAAGRNVYEGGHMAYHYYRDLFHEKFHAKHIRGRGTMGCGIEIWSILLGQFVNVLLR